MDGAFETIEYVGPAGSDHLERFVVLVPADFATRHGSTSVVRKVEQGKAHTSPVAER
jgi:hypothetical protein